MSQTTTHWLGAASSVAALLTAIATLVYVAYSVGMLKQLRVQTATLERSTRFDAVKRVIDTLEALRPARRVVYHLDANAHPLWSDEQKAAADQVSRAFDIFGFLDRNGYVPRELLDQFYSYPAVMVWQRLGPFIDAERVRRRQFGHMAELEQLAARAAEARSRRAASGTVKGAPTPDAA